MAAAHWHGNHWHGNHWHANHWYGGGAVVVPIPDFIMRTSAAFNTSPVSLSAALDTRVDLEAALDTVLNTTAKMTERL